MSEEREDEINEAQEEILAAVEDAAGEALEGDGDFGDLDGFSGEIDAGALLAEAEEDQLRARASWHLLPKEMFSFAFANCLLLAGVLGAWSRAIPADWAIAWNAANPKGKIPVADLDPSTYLNGLDTIRGTILFAFVLYGFLQILFNVVGRTIRIWPYMVGGLLALEIGITGISRSRGGEAWDAAGAYLESAESKTMFDDLFLQWSAIPPAYWALTFGGVIVLIVALSGIMKGAQKAKAAEEETGRRRR